MEVLSTFRKTVPFWFFAMLSYSVFRFYGLDVELEQLNVPSANRGVSFLQAIWIFSLLGIALGVFYGVIELLFEKYVSKRMGIGITQLLKALSYFFSTIMMVSITAFIASSFLDIGLDIHFGWWAKDKRFWSVIYYIILCSFIFYFINSTAERFGKGKYVKALIGKYRVPKEEKVIFMFLDLRDSTTIAERLGHHKYSQLIQDCFFDLNEVLLAHRAQIYQYVGDEAVIYWPYEKGVLHNNCVRLFFAFENLRDSNREKYLKKYGVYPEFKAGVHGGKLIAVEVGHVKKELAYHGDVINTAARIQAECNKQNARFLISEELLMALKKRYKTSSKFVGNVFLKGKKKGVNIHAITA
ncbi:MAG: adenylate/guanylate cyclase domain-containing protein [Bacteroidota bacterium]